MKSLVIIHVWWKIFDYCLNVLRDNEHLTGDKALRTLAHLLVLRLIEPKIGNIVPYAPGPGS